MISICSISWCACIACLRAKESSFFQMLKYKLQTCWYKIKENRFSKLLLNLCFYLMGNVKMLLDSLYISVYMLIAWDNFLSSCVLSLLKFLRKTNPDCVWIMLLSERKIKIILFRLSSWSKMKKTRYDEGVW